MDIQTVTEFFKWCTLINGSLLLLWSFFCLLTPELVVRTQQYFFPLPREIVRTVVYCFLGVFKLFFLLFNVTPYVTLLIIR